MSEMYNVIANIEELKWFFDNVLTKPAMHESYAAVFCARYKKLTDEERAEVGISKRDAEFMATQTFRVRKFRNALDFERDDGWNFDNFIKHLRRFNVDKCAYLTAGGYPLPEKCLATIFYVNPCDEIKVADEVMRKLEETKTAIVKALLNGKTLEDNMQSYQAFSNIESNVKHARAHCKGSVYWLDYDLDCPAWYKDPTAGFFKSLVVCLDSMFKRGNYLIVDTAGGYHILIRTKAVHEDPHRFCARAKQLYLDGLREHNPPHIDTAGNDKFECIVNDSQIPGIPLPGTFQYGRPVKIINKQDFKIIT